MIWILFALQANHFTFICIGGFIVMSSVESLAVIGLGTQGAQIAFRAAYYGKQVHACDALAPVVDNCKEKIEGWMKEYCSEEKLEESAFDTLRSRIIYYGSLEEACKGVQMVIEVVPERLELKQKVWAQIDKAADPGTWITSNSSSLRSSDMGRDVARKELTFNLNFMTPVKDDLVEVMWNANTSEAIKPDVIDCLLELNLIPIVTNKEIKGFSQNRIWRAIKKEALKLWDQGYSDYQDMDRAFMMDFGTGYGPFGLMDIVGLDVIRDIENSYYQDSGDESDKPPQKLLDLIAEGKLGCKSGEGFYKYPNPAYRQDSWMRKRG